MTVLRLLNYPLTLVSREDAGEDEWGSPVYEDVRVATNGYYRLIDTGDEDDGGTVTHENYEIFVSVDTQVSNLSAVEFDLAGEIIQVEVLGRPAPELNARTGRANHIKIRARRAVA